MIIIITGASSGIGRALTLHYMALGHYIVAISRSEDKLLALEKECAVLKGTVATFSADVCDSVCIKKIVDTVISEQGVPDLVIANAGIGLERETYNLDLNILQQTLKTNVEGVANTFIHVVPHMLKKREGHLVAISSLASAYPLPRMSEYCCAKIGLNYLLESLHWSLKPKGVHVSTICPGFIDTPLTRQNHIPKYWCMSLDKATVNITRLIEKKLRLSYFPRSLYYLLRSLYFMPDFIKNIFANRIFDRLFSRTPISD